MNVNVLNEKRKVKHRYKRHRPAKSQMLTFLNGDEEPRGLGGARQDKRWDRTAIT